MKTLSSLKKLQNKLYFESRFISHIKIISTNSTCSSCYLCCNGFNHSGFRQISIERNLPGDDDVQFDVIYCGVCHSDVHVGLDQLGGTMWPFVGGHELGNLYFHVMLKIL